MIVNEEGILEFLSQTKDALDSYINLRNTNILSVAFTKDEYDDLWKIFFDTIGIDARYNPKCQQTLIPNWYRKNMPEFNKKCP